MPERHFGVLQTPSSEPASRPPRFCSLGTSSRDGSSLDQALYNILGDAHRTPHMDYLYATLPYPEPESGHFQPQSLGSFR